MMERATRIFPAARAGMDAAKWRRILEGAYERFCNEVDSGRPTFIDEYAAEHPAEFFAVMSEAFFTESAVLGATADLYRSSRFSTVGPRGAGGRIAALCAQRLHRASPSFVLLRGSPEGSAIRADFDPATPLFMTCGVDHRPSRRPEWPQQLLHRGGYRSRFRAGGVAKPPADKH